MVKLTDLNSVSAVLEELTLEEKASLVSGGGKKKCSSRGKRGICFWRGCSFGYSLYQYSERSKRRT